MKPLSLKPTFESARTEDSAISPATPLAFTLFPNTEEGEGLRKQKYSLLLQWEETRCTKYADRNSLKFRAVLESGVARLNVKADVSREVNISIVRFLREKLKSDQQLSSSLRHSLSHLPSSPVPSPISSALFTLSTHQSLLSDRLLALGSQSEQ